MSASSIPTASHVELKLPLQMSDKVTSALAGRIYELRILVLIMEPIMEAIAVRYLDDFTLVGVGLLQGQSLSKPTMRWP